MMMLSQTEIENSASIEECYRKNTHSSERLYTQALTAMPSGITHDLRWQTPYPLYVSRGEGCRKWDVDGNEYIDYLSGHGALLLGHGRSELVEAVQHQLERGTHLGGNHELEVRWAQLVQQLIPSAERVRFTASGTEATLLALRLARAHTGRSKFIRFAGHFHGWHDHFVTGYSSHFDGSVAPGVLPEVASATLLANPGDEESVNKYIDSDPDIAAIVVEPTGGHFGSSPLDPSFLKFLRDAANAANIVLIFDEVVTGFRVSPGGAQAHYNIVPDLTTLGKILAGGLNGGAIAGRADIMGQLDFAVSANEGREKIAHAGTFNGNPLSAAAGVAALQIVATTDVCDKANRYCADLRHALNEVLADEGLTWVVYGEFSGFNLFTNPKGHEISPLDFDPIALHPLEIVQNDTKLMMLIRLGMLINGVDLTPRFSGWVSAVHGYEELHSTVTAFRNTIGMLRREPGLTI